MAERMHRPRVDVYRLVEDEWFLQLTLHFHARDEETEQGGPQAAHNQAGMLLTIVIPRCEGLFGAQIIEGDVRVAPEFDVHDAEIVPERRSWIRRAGSAIWNALKAIGRTAWGVVLKEYVQKQLE